MDKRRFDLAQNEQRYRNGGQTLPLTDFSVLTDNIIFGPRIGQIKRMDENENRDFVTDKKGCSIGSNLDFYFVREVLTRE